METAPETLFDTRHLLALESGRLSDLVSRMTGVPTERVIELLRLGALYAEEERATSDREIPSGTYLRAHLKPKRYSTQIDWKSRIIFENPQFLAVNKPHGIPVHPTVDNIIENTLAQLAALRGEPLYVTQRLDVMTQGVLIVARTKEFQSAFNLLLQEKKVKKIYEARLEKQLETLEYTHFMLTSPRSPKKMANESSGPDWKECRLRVMSCEPGPLGWRTQIELLTGRTHQIRAQLAHLGSPLVGDRVYGSSGDEADFYLCARETAFICPITRESHQFFTP